MEGCSEANLELLFHFSILFASSAKDLACKQSSRAAHFKPISSHECCLGFVSYRMACLLVHNVLFQSSPPHIGSLGESFSVFYRQTIVANNCCPLVLLTKHYSNKEKFLLVSEQFYQK